MKNSITIFCFIASFSLLQAQSWQQEIELPGDPFYLEETDSGTLKVIYHNLSLDTWGKSVFDQAGNYLGEEVFEPVIYTGSHQIIQDGSEKFLINTDTAGNVVWQTTLTNIPNSASLSVTNSGLSVIRFSEFTGPSSTLGKILIFDVNGSQIFNRTANGPLSLNGWNVNFHNDGSLFIAKYSSDPFTPQGAGSSIYNYFKFNSSGENTCTDSGNSSNWAGSRVVHRMAKNGANRCGSIGRISAGLWNPENPSGQFIPCTNQLVEYPNIPVEIAMIGLQSNAYATLGTTDNKVILTRIDCSDPIINKLCLGTLRDTYDYSICEGDSLSFADTTVMEAGYYERRFVTERGCDSLITVNLSIDTTVISIDPEITSGGIYYMIYLNSDCEDCHYNWGNGGNLVTQNYGWHTAVITSPGGCSLTYEFYLEPLVPTATDDLSDEIFFRIPNPVPVNSVVNIFTNLQIDDSYTIKIYDVQGKQWTGQNNSLILNKQFESPSNPGIYFVGLYRGNKIVARQKIIVL